MTKTERIASVEDKIKQLENQRKQLIQKQKADERKARTKRLIERGAILESLIADAETLTNEQVKAFLQKVIQGKASTETSTPTKRELSVPAPSGGDGCTDGAAG